MEDQKLLALLDVVIDHYIDKGDPVGSKFLHSLEDMHYAPSTLRKYLNALEKAGLVYQPYNSSGRIPTVQGMTRYLENYIEHQEVQQDIEVKNARKGLKYLVESLGSIVDGVVVGFLRNDEYYYLGMNNLLRDDLRDQYDVTRKIIKFIEDRAVVKFLDQKMVKKNKIYYTFVEDKKTIISCVYAKIQIDGYESILTIVGPMRVDYKKNINILSNIIKKLCD